MKKFVLVLMSCILFILADTAPAAFVETSGNFLELIEEIKQHMPGRQSYGFVVPSDNELQDWENALLAFINGDINGSATIVSNYDYSLFLFTDDITGNEFYIFKEDYPVGRGWGTYVFNTDAETPLYTHVNHPKYDINTHIVGAETFIETHSQWFLMAGTHRYANCPQGTHNCSSDMARTRQSVFQRFHEILIDSDHYALSIHGFSKNNHGWPINMTHVVLSNGTTSDYKWEVSEISIDFKSNIQEQGLVCGLTFHDPGYEPLSGNINPQGQYTNDNIGFGHWIHVEIERDIRDNRIEYYKIIAAINKTFGIDTDIKANNSDGPIDITTDDNLLVTIQLDSGIYGDKNADWWVVADTPFGWYYYDVTSDTWKAGQTVTYQGPLFNLSPYQVLNMSGLPAGTYKFYFGVDLIMNGSIDYGELHYDRVVVDIVP